MLTRAALLLTLVLASLPLGAWAAPAAELASTGGKVTLETRVTQRVTRDDDGGAEEIVYLEDTWLAPGAILRYELIIHNQAESEAVAAESLLVTTPLPEGVQFLEGLKPSGPVIFMLSADGGVTFEAPEKVAPASVTHLQWRIMESLPPEARRALAFEARLL
jgi:hypothetical protein